MSTSTATRTSNNNNTTTTTTTSPPPSSLSSDLLLLQSQLLEYNHQYESLAKEILNNNTIIGKMEEEIKNSKIKQCEALGYSEIYDTLMDELDNIVLKLEEYNKKKNHAIVKQEDINKFISYFDENNIMDKTTPPFNFNISAYELLDKLKITTDLETEHLNSITSSLDLLKEADILKLSYNDSNSDNKISDLHVSSPFTLLERREEHVNRIVETERMNYELSKVLSKIKLDLDDNKIDKQENELITKLQFEELEKASAEAAFKTLSEFLKDMRLKADKFYGDRLELQGYSDEINNFEKIRSTKQGLLRNLVCYNASLADELGVATSKNRTLYNEIFAVIEFISKNGDLIIRENKKELDLAWSYNVKESNVPKLDGDLRPLGESLQLQSWKSIESLMDSILARKDDMFHTQQLENMECSVNKLIQECNFDFKELISNFNNYNQIETEQFYPAIKNTIASSNNTLTNLNSKALQLNAEWKLEPAQHLPIVRELKVNNKSLEHYNAQYKALLTTFRGK